MCLSTVYKNTVTPETVAMKNVMKIECQGDMVILTDLMERISARHASGAIRKADGTPAELNKLVRSFELLLNVSFKNPDRCRNAALNRKVSVTKFLDALKQALVERSQR